METAPVHKALIVGHREKVDGFLRRDALPESLELFFSESGEAALEQLASGPGDYALVVSDHKLLGMAGIDFFMKVKADAPDAVRLLITRYSEMELIMRSVNTGLVDRYILKKKGAQGAAKEITTALKQYEMQMEARVALKQAKKLNRRLHQLDTELIDSTKSLDQAHQEMDRKIAALEVEIREIRQGLEEAPETPVAEEVNQERLDSLYLETVSSIFTQFEEIAKRNGFQMPVPGQVGNHDGDFTAQSPDA